MWCKNCNMETNEKYCPVCGEETIEDLPVEVYWCSHCKIPVIQVANQADIGLCPLCGTYRIQQKHNAEANAVQIELKTIAKRIADIDKRIPLLTLLQFIEKRRLKEERDELMQKQSQLVALASKIDASYKALLEKENKRYSDAISMVQ